METGLTYTSRMVVAEHHLALHVGSGDLPVLATPMMMAMMENAAMMAVKDAIGEGNSTVGGQISSSHIRPTGLGHVVMATAELIAVDGRKLTFRVSACDEQGLIGEGEHIRFIVSREKFMANVV